VRRRAWAAARLLGGVLILALLVRQVGADAFLDGLRGLGPGTVLGALAIGAVTTVCAAWRWRLVAAALGVGLAQPDATAAYYRSQFLNSVLPGGVVGDVHRGLRHGMDAGDLGRGVRAVVWERVAGQVVLAGFAVAVLLMVPSPVHAAVPAIAAIGAGVVGVLLVTCRVLVRHGPARLAGALSAVAAEARRALLRPGTVQPVLVASVVVLGGHLAMFVLAARAAGVHASPQQLLPLALVVLLAAGIPLNVGGWGPREGAAAWAFAATEWGAPAGAAVATAFGVLTLVSVLPGAVVVLAGRRRRTLPAPRRPWLPAPRAGGTDAEPAAEILHSGTREDGAAHG
jgi:uncharacterized membrane protein YbhN (UPF0104 family)